MDVNNTKNKPKTELARYSFTQDGKRELSSRKKSQNWPVVYLISNDKELYIGETQNAVYRMEQHLNNENRQKLTDFNVIFDDEFNKSAILDLEQNLIQLCGADKKFKLQNMNGGQSFKHDYYERSKYLNKIDFIWAKLKKLNLANHELDELRNSNLFKYSPYNTLTLEQAEVSNAIIEDAIKHLNEGKEGTAIINGGAGTGKTIVLTNLAYKFISAPKIQINDSGEDEDLTDYLHIVLLIQNFIKSQRGKQLKLAYVCPMASLRKTMKRVFTETGNGLTGNMVVGPYDLFDGEEKFDLVLVDEAHRLSRRKNLVNFNDFDKHAKDIGMDPNVATQLDMIIARSKYRILVYDKSQTVKGSDITEGQFQKALKNSGYIECNLKTQMRCNGKEDFIDCVNAIFECNAEKEIKFDKDLYDFKLFDDVGKMVDEIKRLDTIYGLCRCAAGYSWKWISKPYKKYGYKYIIDHGLQDIKIKNHRFVWNMTNEEFILSEGAVNQIGCIHTTQGYDLNYVGLIFGEEIDYDPAKNEIVIDRSNFFDTNVKRSLDDEELKKMIINSYKVMMTRGIKGCYLYACNDNLRNYLRKMIKE